MLESCDKLQPKPKIIPEFNDALQTDLVCITGDRNQQCRERLPQVIAGMCVSQRHGGLLEQKIRKVT